MVRRSYHGHDTKASDTPSVPLRQSRFRKMRWKCRPRYNDGASEAGMYAAAIVIVILAALLFAYLYMIRPWHLHWGATHLDRIAALPGDALSPYASAVVTHAVNIDAPAEAVWRWLVQIGQDRGGFYTYSFLEKLAGCHMHNPFR